MGWHRLVVLHAVEAGVAWHGERGLPVGREQQDVTVSDLEAAQPSPRHHCEEQGRAVRDFRFVPGDPHRRDLVGRVGLTLHVVGHGLAPVAQDLGGEVGVQGRLDLGGSCHRRQPLRMAQRRFARHVHRHGCAGGTSEMPASAVPVGHGGDDRIPRRRWGDENERVLARHRTRDMGGTDCGGAAQEPIAPSEANQGPSSARGPFRRSCRDRGGSARQAAGAAEAGPRWLAGRHRPRTSATRPARRRPGVPRSGRCCRRPAPARSGLR